MSYGGFVYLYISIDVEFEGAENEKEAKGQPDYKGVYYSGSELQCCVSVLTHLCVQDCMPGYCLPLIRTSA